MRIIVLLNALKVGSLRTRQMLKVDLCANGAGAYAPYAPPLPTGLITNHSKIAQNNTLYVGMAPTSPLCVHGTSLLRALPETIIIVYCIATFGHTM